MNIELNEDQLRAQIQLNDIACKAGGLQVAEAVVVLTKIYEAALKVPTTETKKVSEEEGLEKE